MHAMESLPTLRGARLALRPPRREDAEALGAIRAEGEVARWWGACEPDRVGEELIESGEGWIIEVERAVAGWLEYAELSDPDYRSVGLDIFLTTPLHGRGYGREALRLAIDHFLARGHHRFTIDPATRNERAIRTYSAIGFRPVGVMRAYERGPDGTWHDGLLMDLLAGELER
jgi:aminoglycoside 6'-N-acetyltransferase